MMGLRIQFVGTTRNPTMNDNLFIPEQHYTGRNMWLHYRHQTYKIVAKKIERILTLELQRPPDEWVDSNQFQLNIIRLIRYPIARVLLSFNFNLELDHISDGILLRRRRLSDTMVLDHGHSKLSTLPQHPTKQVFR